MKIRNAVLTVVLAGLFGSAASAQNATIRPSPEFPVRATPRSAEEQQAFFEVQNASTPRDMLRESNDFLSDYIDSEYRHLVLFYEWRARGELGQDVDNIEPVVRRAVEAQNHFLTMKLSFIDDPSQVEELPEVQFTLANREGLFYQSLVEGYLAEGDFDAVMEYGELALAALEDATGKFEAVGTPGTPEYDQQVEVLRGSRLFVLNTMLDRFIEEEEFDEIVRVGSRIVEISPDTFVLRTIMQGYQDQGNTEETLAWGRRLLEASPDDLNTLIAVSLILSEQEPGDDAAAHWQETRDYAARASEQLDVFLAGPDSASLNDNQKDDLITDVNTTLGFAALQIQEFPESAAAIRKALEGSPEDANLYSMLAIAEQGNRSLEGMMSALARAVYLDHPDDNLRASLTAIYQNVNGSTDGLEGYIESQGDAIGN